MRRVCVWVYEDCVASAAHAPIDVLLAANAVWAFLNREKGKVKPLFEWRVESPNGRPVRTASGYTIEVDGAIDGSAPADAVIMPAIFLRNLESLTATLGRLKPIAPLLRAQHERGAILAANCTSAFLLAEAGLLDGRTATVHWAVAKYFRQRYPEVNVRPDEMLTDQDRIICGAGCAYLSMSLRLVERFAGEGLAKATAESLLIDANRAPLTASNATSLQDFMPAQADPLVTRAQQWMQARLRMPFQLDGLARDLGVSKRTINRRFNDALGKTPIAYLQTLRIETGKRFLETTKMSVESVAALVGYGDANFFGRVFKRRTGLSPREYHYKFRRRHAA
jgi:transcriptional regulator GlxA family with amidase domain